MAFHKSLCLLELFRDFPKKWATPSLDMPKSRKSSWYLLTTSFMNSSYCNLALFDSFDAKCLFSYSLSMTFVNMLMTSALLHYHIPWNQENKNILLCGDLSCSFKTVLFSMTEQNSLNFNFCVAVVLDYAESTSVALGSLLSFF